MNQKTSNTHIEQINHRFKQECLLISSGLIFHSLSQQIKPVSAVKLAISLNLTVYMVRRSLLELEKDGLAQQNFFGDWEVGF